MRFLALLLGLTSLAFAATPESPAIQQLRGQILHILERTKTPGAAVAIVRRDGPEWVAGLGLADVARKIPATDETLFRIGSTSKAFVSLSLLKLQREGKLNLNDTLASHAPELAFSNPWEASDPVRLVNLVEHTAGWDDMAICEYAYVAPDTLGLREALAFHPRTRRSRWKPGTRFSYSNEGPPVAAYVVERVTGQRFEDYVAEHWFRPIGMRTATYFEPNPDVPAAILYRSDGKSPFPYWHILLRPAGSINASARDMAAYVQFYLNRGRANGVALLPPEDIARMETPTSTYAARQGLPTGYGLSDYTTVTNGWVFYGHNGGVNGGLTEMSYLPEAGVGFAVMINSGNGRALKEISDLLRKHLTANLTKPAVPPPSTGGHLDLRKWAGWYQPIAPRIEYLRPFTQITGTVRVQIKAGQLRLLTLARGKDARYVPTGAGLFRREGDPAPTLALIADTSEGRLIQNGMSDTYRRVSAPVVAAEAVITMLLPFAILGTIGFGVVWFIRLRLHRLNGVTHLSVRVLPLLASLALVGLAIVVAVGVLEPFDRLGRLNGWTASIWLLSVAFPALALAGLVQALRRREGSGSRLAWWHAFLTSTLFSIVAIYFGAYGLWGWRVWD